MIPGKREGTGHNEESDGLVIVQEALSSEPAQTLIRALNAELREVYPETGATHFRLDESEVSEGQGAFLVCYLRTRPVGCGAIRRLEHRVAEIKRMYVSPAARGLGLGRAILRELEAQARGLGLRRLVLETGVRQSTALRLYQQAGFVAIPAFDEYADSPLSVCLGKDL